MGYQNSTFPLAIYGCLDTASRKLLWLRVWTSNCNPKVVGRWYLDYLYETRVIPAMLRVDRGSETGIMATMHAFLRRHHGNMEPSETVVYGPSTANQVTYVSVHLYFFGTHIGSVLKKTQYFQMAFPTTSTVSQNSLPVTEEQLKEAGTLSGVLNFPEDFLKPEFRAECECVIPDSDNIRPHECRDAYMYLKSNFQV
ncbi:unnamed protein product [Porites evermanni]|uniref:Uncharacterized protein n=1 Tax=Porites evermanni TaxID=104178 RepID=A0ABN8PE16_9CNID|nr:unnamed protein product [Porites evermanni]